MTPEQIRPEAKRRLQTALRKHFDADLQDMSALADEAHPADVGRRSISAASPHENPQPPESEMNMESRKNHTNNRHKVLARVRNGEIIDRTHGKRKYLIAGANGVEPIKPSESAAIHDLLWCGSITRADSRLPAFAPEGSKLFILTSAGAERLADWDAQHNPPTRSEAVNQSPQWSAIEAARKCNVGRATIQRAIYAKKLPNAVRTDKGWQIPLEDLLAAGFKPDTDKEDDPEPIAPTMHFRDLTADQLDACADLIEAWGQHPETWQALRDRATTMRSKRN